MSYSFRGRFRKEYWTLSAWQGNRDLLPFIRAMPHARVMTVFPSFMERFGSVRWKVKGSALRLNGRKTCDDSTPRWPKA